jgi:hypothetical protein
VTEGKNERKESKLKKNKLFCFFTARVKLETSVQMPDRGEKEKES